MDGHHVPGEIVLSTEGTTARLVVTGVGLKAVRIMGLDVGLEVVRASERYNDKCQYMLLQYTNL